MNDLSGGEENLAKSEQVDFAVNVGNICNKQRKRERKRESDASYSDSCLLFSDSVVPFWII